MIYVMGCSVKVLPSLTEDVYNQQLAIYVHSCVFIECTGWIKIVLLYAYPQAPFSGD